MRDERGLTEIHPTGEGGPVGDEPPETTLSLDNFGGKIHVKWVPGGCGERVGRLLPVLAGHWRYAHISAIRGVWLKEQLKASYESFTEHLRIVPDVEVLTTGICNASAYLGTSIRAYVKPQGQGIKRPRRTRNRSCRSCWTGCRKKQ